jgi:hypothetical protein
MQLNGVSTPKQSRATYMLDQLIEPVFLILVFLPTQAARPKRRAKHPGLRLSRTW